MLSLVHVDVGIVEPLCERKEHAIDAISVGNNINLLPVEAIKSKLSYADVVNALTAVQKQNELIAGRRSPTD